MQQKIFDVIAGVLQELKNHGLLESTVQQYQKRLLKPVLRYFIDNTDGLYNESLLEIFFERYQNDFDTGQIGRHHFQSMRRVVNYVKEYATTGKVSFDRITNTKLFLPSEEALSIIRSALDATELKENFKYKIDCMLRKFFCFTEAKGIGVRDITAVTVREFINFAYHGNSGSMEYVMYALKVFIAYLKTEKEICIDIDLDFFSPKSKRKKIIAAFTKEEVASMLSHIDTSTSAGKRNYAIILLACGTGLRGIDVVHLKLTDIDWKAGTLNIIQRKTERPLLLPLNGQTLNAIADYILNGRPNANSKNLFLRENAPYTPFKGTAALDGIIDKTCNIAGVAKKPFRSFHSFRRSFGSWMAYEEVPVTTISQLLGHKNMNSSMRYLSFNDKQMLGCALSFEDIPLKGGVYA